jgi:hypothetical protein
MTFKNLHPHVLAVMLMQLFTLCNNAKGQQVGLTLIPPTAVTDKINLDIRAGIKNLGSVAKTYHVIFYLNKEKQSDMLFNSKVTVAPGKAECVKFLMPTANRVGKNKIILTVKSGEFTNRETKDIEILAANTRSTKAIGGAWISFYHWSEKEGKMWNPVIKQLSDDQWKQMINGMHKIGMEVVVIQESFRNQENVGKHTMEVNGYHGKAYYPSKLYTGRMPIAAKDPMEAVLSEADKLGMHVFMGVGMYAWFDYTTASLAWHKKVAKELWEMYGQHPSFYGFYVSEEGMGSLDCFETDTLKQPARRKEVLNFFKEFTPFCKQLAPDKPVMFAPNGWGVGRANGAYTGLLKNVDIISPFAFARMPKGDLSGKDAINLLQQYCDQAKSHLWLDLEAFLFNEKEGYLYPRPMHEIKQDLDQFNSFEKVICYQYPGVFNDPKMPVRVGEPSTVQLYLNYQKYLDSLSKTGLSK